MSLVLEVLGLLRSASCQCSILKIPLAGTSCLGKGSGMLRSSACFLAVFAVSVCAYQEDPTGQANSLFEDGVEALNEGAPLRARQAFTEALGQLADSPESTTLRGRILRGIGETYSDEADYPQFFEFNRAALPLLEQGSGNELRVALLFVDVAKILDVVARDPDLMSTPTCFCETPPSLAVGELRQHRLAEARELCARGLALLPSEERLFKSEAHALLAALSMQVGLRSDADASFKEALRVLGDDPGNDYERAQVHSHWGKSLRDTGQVRQAYEQFSLALSYLPVAHDRPLDRVGMLCEMGTCCILLSKPTQGLVHFQDALGICDGINNENEALFGRLVCLQGLGRLYVSSNRPAQAMGVFHEAQGRDHGDESLGRSSASCSWHPCKHGTATH